MTDLHHALELTLNSIIDLRAAQPPEPLRRMSSAELAAMPILSREECTARDLADPKEHKLAMATLTLRWIGEQLYDAGGIDHMRETLQSVAECYPGRGGRMLSIADHKWDGIGCTADRAGWVT
jgi:hypothetical protein